jgi:hypothetical protein
VCRSSLIWCWTKPFPPLILFTREIFQPWKAIKLISSSLFDFFLLTEHNIQHTHTFYNLFSLISIHDFHSPPQFITWSWHWKLKWKNCFARWKIISEWMGKSLFFSSEVLFSCKRAKFFKVFNISLFFVNYKEKIKNIQKVFPIPILDF